MVVSDGQVTFLSCINYAWDHGRIYFRGPLNMEPMFSGIFFFFFFF